MTACLISLISGDVLLGNTPSSPTHNPLSKLLAAPMSGRTWETRLECQWAATAGRTTWSHHSHMILHTHTHAHAAILARAATQLLTKSKNGGNHDLHAATCASIHSLSFCTDVCKLRCGVRRLIDPLPVQTGNAFLRRVFQRAAL